MSPDKLPETWRRIRLEEVAEVVMGQSPPSSAYNETGHGLPFFQGKAEFGTLYPIVKKWTIEGNKRALPGDILISVRAPVGPTNVANTECVIGRGLSAIRVGHLLRQTFLLWYLRSIENEIASRGTGTTFSSISGDSLRKTHVSVPSKQEQDEIVRILEEQLSRLEAATAAIAAVRTKLDQFRYSLLHAAFTGAFTHTGAHRMSANSPTKWQSRPLAELVDDFQPGFASGKHNAQGRGIVHVRPMNVSRNGLLDFAELKFIETEEGHRLCQGDVLFNNTNSPALVGKTAFVDTDRELAFSNHMTRLRVNRKSVDAKFLAIQLHSLWHKGFFKEICSNHVNQASVSTKRLGQVEVVLPSLEEQTEVVRILEEQFSRQEAILASVDSVEQNLDALRRSLLHAAFSGELTKDWRERDRG